MATALYRCTSAAFVDYFYLIKLFEKVYRVYLWLMSTRGVRLYNTEEIQKSKVEGTVYETGLYPNCPLSVCEIHPIQ
jgi:hypothetical protein